MISGAIDLRYKTAISAMTPLSKVWLPPDAAVACLEQQHLPCSGTKTQAFPTLNTRLAAEAAAAGRDVGHMEF